MANCVLCGKELGRLEAVKIEFHGTQQLLCDDCHIRFVRCADGDRLAMEEKMLASPDLAQRETVLANASARKSCPVCGTPMECKLQNFSIGADGGGGLATLLATQYSVDLYACPQCGKVELYTAGYSRTPSAPRRAPYWCEHCGEPRDKRVCPVCFQVCDLMSDHLWKEAQKKETPPSEAPSESQPPSQEAGEPEPSGFRFPWQKREKPPWEE